MALTAYLLPATSTPGDVGSIDQTRYALVKYIAGLYYGDELEGYSDIGNGLAVTKTTGLGVRVDTGDAVILGGPINNSAVVNRTLAAAHATLDRIDIICLQFDQSLLKSTGATIVVKQGANSNSPSPPTLTRNPSGIWQMPLGQVYVTAGMTTISTVTDVRPKPRVEKKYAAAVGDFQSAFVWHQATAEHNVVSIVGGIPDPNWSNYRLRVWCSVDFTNISAGHMDCRLYLNGNAIAVFASGAGNSGPAQLFRETGPLTGDSTLVVKATPINFGAGDTSTINTAYVDFFAVVVPA